MICRRGVFLSFMMMMILNEWSRVLRIAADRLRRDLTATRRRFGIKSKVRFAALLIVVFCGIMRKNTVLEFVDYDKILCRTVHCLNVICYMNVYFTCSYSCIVVILCVSRIKINERMNERWHMVSFVYYTAHSLSKALREIN